MPSPYIVYVDVDDTLIRSFGSKRMPIPATVRALERWCSREGVVAYCWSSGGGEYARQSARELGIEHLFAGFLPKPNLLVDDVALADWHDLEELHPNAFATAEPPGQ